MKNNRKSISRLLAVTCGLALFVNGAQAAMVTQMGDDVIFTYDGSSLYGMGSVVGNSIFFSPTTFKAESLNASGAVFANETLNIEVEVKAGSDYTIGGFEVAEAGDYRLIGGSTTVLAEGRLQVSSLTTLCGLQTCMEEDLFSAGPLTVQGALTEWTMSGMVDLASVAGWGGDTHVLAQIQNDLLAISTALGDSALVQKKFEGVGIEVIPEVPLPAAAWLFGSALLGLLGVRRIRG